MGRKKYTVVEEATPSVLKLREKKKWQINLRRYVLQQQACPMYAPYFGLDIQSLRQWFEQQFTNEMSWETFGKTWQFDHIVPLNYFNITKEEDLLLCWHFTNLAVGAIKEEKDISYKGDLLLAKSYFTDLFAATGYEACEKMIRKIEELTTTGVLPTGSQIKFIRENQAYLERIQNYSVFEMELLNSGRSKEEVLKEIDLLNTL